MRASLGVCFFLLALLVGSCAAVLLAAPQPINPKFPALSCQAFKKPLVRCEAKNVVNALQWRVYVPGTKQVADYDEGLVVYLTVPDSWTVIEMAFPSTKGEATVSVRARWVDHKIEFQKYKSESPCNTQAVERCA